MLASILRALESVECLTAIKDSERGLNRVVVIKGGDGVISIGLRINITTPGILAADLTHDRGQEVELRCLLVVAALPLLYPRPTEVIAVGDGVGNATVDSPRLLGPHR